MPSAPAADPTRKRKRTVIGIGIGALALLVVAVIWVAAVFVPGALGNGDVALIDAEPTDEAAATVGETGFELELAEGVIVRGDAAVADAGTEVTAELVPNQDAGDFGSFASPVAPTVDITLGDGDQPATPITIEFTFTEEQVAALRTDRLFVLGESASEDREADFVDASWDPATATMTAVVDHLSWYTVTEVDDESLGAQFGRWLGEQADIRVPRPACVDEPTAPSGLYVFANPEPESAWVCARETPTGTQLTLQSNSGLAFGILASPQPDEYGPLLDASVFGPSMVLVTEYMAEANLLEGDAFLLPGNSMDIFFDGEFQGATIEIQVDTALSQLSTLAFGVGMLLLEELAEAAGLYDCMVSTLETAVEGAFGPTFLSCLSALLPGIGGSLLGIVATGPGLLASQFEGIGRLVAGTNNQRFNVNLVAGDAIRELPAGGTWLFERSLGGDYTSGEEDLATVALPGDTSASYPFSTNQWASCTDDPYESRYALDGQYAALDFALAVQTNAPIPLVADFAIEADGVVVYQATVERGRPTERMSLDVSGVDELRVTGITPSRCTSASKGYGALVQAYLTQ